MFLFFYGAVWTVGAWPRVIKDVSLRQCHVRPSWKFVLTPTRSETVPVSCTTSALRNKEKIVDMTVAPPPMVRFLLLG